MLLSKLIPKQLIFTVRHIFSLFSLWFFIALSIPQLTEAYLFTFNLKRLSPNEPIGIGEFIHSLKVTFDSIIFISGPLGNWNLLIILFIFLLGPALLRRTHKNLKLAIILAGVGLGWIFINFIPNYSYLRDFIDIGKYGSSGVTVSFPLFYVWLLTVILLPILLSQIVNRNIQGQSFLRVFSRKVVAVILGFISIGIFAFLHWEQAYSSSYVQYQSETAQSKAEYIQKFYNDPEFVIVKPTYLPKWIGRITEEKQGGNVWIFTFSPVVEARMYYREYSMGALNITQYKPLEAISESELLQKTFENFENPAKPLRYKEKNIEQINIKGYNAVYYEKGVRKYVNLYRDEQLIRISINVNRVATQDRGFYTADEQKQELIRIVESLEAAE